MSDRESKNNELQNQSDLVELNLVQLIQYLYAYRYIIGIFTFAFPSFIALWTFFIQKPVYEAEVAVNVLQEKESQSLSPFKLPAWFEEQEVKNKLLMTKQFFETPYFRSVLLDEVEGVNENIEDNEVNRKGKMILRKYFFSNMHASRSDRANMLSSRLQLIVDEEYNRLVIKAKYHNTIIATALADIAAQVLLEQNYIVLKRRIKSVKTFLKEQTIEVKEDLVELEKRMIYLQKKHKIIALGEVKQKVNSYLIEKKYENKELYSKLIATKMLISELENDLQKLRTDLSSQKVVSYIYLNQLQKRLQYLKYQKEMSQSLKGDDALGASLNSISSEFNSVSSKLKNNNIYIDPNLYISQIEKTLIELNKDKKKIESEFKISKKNFVKLSDEFSVLPLALQEIGELQREIEWKSELYSNLQKRSQEFDIEEAGLPNDLIILSLSEMPVAPIGMKVSKKIILMFFMGFFIAMILLLIYYIVIPTIRNQKDLMNLGIKVIGGLPWCRMNQQGILALSQYPHLILKESSVSKEANAIRHARFKLEKSISIPRGSKRDKGKVLTTCSVKSEEGKTFISANLAYALSLADYKVLLLDLDLMKPNLHHYFPEIEKSNETLVESHDKRLTFHKHSINLYLDLIDTPVIKENVCDFLETNYFTQFLDNFKKNYDLIIIDTPPINGHLESMILAQKSDALLFVANQRKTLRDDLDFAVKNIQEHFNGKSLGILNFIFEELKSSSRNYKKMGFIKPTVDPDINKKVS